MSEQPVGQELVHFVMCRQGFPLLSAEKVALPDTRKPDQEHREARHERQLNQIPPSISGAGDLELLRYKFDLASYTTSQGTKLTCCLFNVIVALEWAPGDDECAWLGEAFEDAGRLLLDATDGYMSFNRIIIGGPELMCCADIQIFASNRLFPRAWVNGLHIKAKYQPIRLGRGYWRKADSHAEPWETSLGPAVIVHEWLHYAVGFKDDYVGTEGLYALPTSSPAQKTLMANLTRTELLPETEWRQLKENPHFNHKIEIKPEKRKKSKGVSGQIEIDEAAPKELVAPEIVASATAAPGAEDELRGYLRWEEADLSACLDPEHCWVFVLGGDGSEGSPLDAPGRLIAQGSYEDLRWGYPIFGARAGDYIVLVGREPGSGAPRTLCRKVAGLTGKALVFEGDGWREVTPLGSKLQPPIVAAGTAATEPPYPLSFSFGAPLAEGWRYALFALGEAGPSPDGRVSALDGHVMLSATGGDRPQLAIASFSIGGSPGAAYPASPNPVPAGSSDGNAMIFFFDEDARKVGTEAPGEEPITHEASALRIITTTNLARSAVGGVRSYTFGLMPNILLPVDKDTGAPKYRPTLVLYFDGNTKRENPAGRLIIERLDGDKWQPLDASYQKEDPARWLVAAQLNKHTAPGFFPADPSAAPAPEYYRLLLAGPESAQPPA